MKVNALLGIKTMDWNELFLREGHDDFYYLVPDNIKTNYVHFKLVISYVENTLVSFPGDLIENKRVIHRGDNFRESLLVFDSQLIENITYYMLAQVLTKGFFSNLFYDEEISKSQKNLEFIKRTLSSPDNYDKIKTRYFTTGTFSKEMFNSILELLKDYEVNKELTPLVLYLKNLPYRRV